MLIRLIQADPLDLVDLLDRRSAWKAVAHRRAALPASDLVAEQLRPKSFQGVEMPRSTNPISALFTHLVNSCWSGQLTHLRGRTRGHHLVN